MELARITVPKPQDSIGRYFRSPTIGIDYRTTLPLPEPTLETANR